jgi:ankyrin repeat protein
LLANGAEKDVRDANGNTPLHIAVLYRRAENLDEVLKVNPNVDEINAEGYAPLHLAVMWSNNEKAIELLFLEGADVNILDPMGKNALLVSIGSHQIGYIKLLVSTGIDINSQNNYGNTALHYPIFNVLKNKMYLPYSKEIVKNLVEEGADPNVKNKDGKTPMDLAVESEENELINLMKSSIRK